MGEHYIWRIIWQDILPGFVMHWSYRIDVLSYLDFDMEKMAEYAHIRNPRLEIFPVNAVTGEGVEAWCGWLRRQVPVWQESF